MCISWIPACGLKSREGSGKNIERGFRESVKKRAVSHFTGVMNSRQAFSKKLGMTFYSATYSGSKAGKIN